MLLTAGENHAPPESSQVAKTPTEIKSLARAHSESALNVLAGIMNETSSPHAARVAAANSLLDRGWGKAAQIVAGDEDLPGIKIEQIERVIVKASDQNG
jgi:hypothetical protein